MSIDRDHFFRKFGTPEACRQEVFHLTREEWDWLVENQTPGEHHEPGAGDRLFGHPVVVAGA